MNILSRNPSKRYFVFKRNIFDSLSSLPTCMQIPSDILATANNDNCCGNSNTSNEASMTSSLTKLDRRKSNRISNFDELKVQVPKQRKSPEMLFYENLDLYNEIINNSWPISKERIENLIVTNKRCHFSNEAISIKPITAVPGIGKKYGQLLADHGFIYARQLLGYYMMLKDNEMFRKWLEYKFNIPTFRAVEITSALNELIRRTI